MFISMINTTGKIKTMYEKKEIWHIFEFVSLTYFPSDNTYEVRFMTYSGANHRVTLKMFLHCFWEALMPHIFI